MPPCHDLGLAETGSSPVRSAKKTKVDLFSFYFKPKKNSNQNCLVRYSRAVLVCTLLNWLMAKLCSMKKKLRGLYLLISSLFIYIVHASFAFAKSAGGTKLIHHSDNRHKTTAPVEKTMPPTPAKSIYDSLHLNIAGLSRQAFDYAKKGLEKLLQQGQLANDSVISIADFSQPSNKRRLYILDIKNCKILFHTLVAHGKNSGKEWATSFSNQHASYKSSPGFFITKETYSGSNGYSLKLVGTEPGINDNAYERGIVLHGAAYVSQDFVNAQGYIGRSEGCPAVPVSKAASIIQTIKNGTCFFIYNPSSSYLRRSSILK